MTAVSTTTSQPRTYDTPRQHPRVCVNLRATAGDDPVVLADMGLGGLCLAARLSVDVGWHVFVRFRLLRTQVCEGAGHVVWTDDGRAGVAFDETNETLATFLRTLSRLPESLRELYVADVSDPELAIVPARAA